MRSGTCARRTRHEVRRSKCGRSRHTHDYDLAAGPFYGSNRPGAKEAEPVIRNWWRQGMMGGAKAHYDGIVAFSQTDFTEDLKKIPCRFW
jgi:non-heme chloroperoxidase